MSIKLTDTQLLMLSAAAQREDRILAIPPKLKGGAAQKVAAKLIAASFVKEIKAKAEAPAWRRDAESGLSFALKLTAAGLKASATDNGVAANKSAKTEMANDGASVGSKPPVASAPRDGTKISRVVGLLRRDDGATLDEVIAATGWLPHTSRAALTGLRKRGYAIEKRVNAEGRRGYVIAAAPQGSTT
ncbi:MAG: DUF3489 domain-containing protein [Roseiarcus sp.]|jgi:hypothetical protein